MTDSRRGAGFQPDSERQPLLRNDEARHQDIPQTDHVSHHDIPAQIEPNTKNVEYVTKFKLAAVMWNFMVNGIALTGLGVLLSRLEEFYDINDAVASYIFPTGVAGYLLAMLLIQLIHHRFGRRGIAILSPLLRFCAMVILSIGSPFFPVTLAGHFVYGFGTGFSDAGLCAWASAVPFANVVQGLMHGSYSVGAVLGPLITVAMLQKGFEWYSFYRVVGVLVILEFIGLALAFRSDDAATYHKTVAEFENESESNHTEVVDGGNFSNPFRYTATIVGGLYCLIDVGFESCFTDWIPIFISRIRHGTPTSSSLSSSIFWIGMGTGRFFLGPITQHFGLSSSLTIYTSLCTIFLVLLHLWNSITMSLVLLAGVGFFSGPLFPSGVILLAQKLPRRLHVSGVASIAALGQVGAGLAPLVVGLVAERVGIGRFLDLVLLLAMAMLGVWIGFVNVKTSSLEGKGKRRRDIVAVVVVEEEDDWDGHHGDPV